MNLFRFFVVGLFVYLMTRVLAHPGNPWRVLDIPNSRSLHETPMPRTGGLAILLGLAVAWGIFRPTVTIAAATIAGAVAAVAMVSWWDDRISLAPWVRLIAQVTAAAIVVIWGKVRVAGVVLPGVPLVLPISLKDILTIGYLVWCMNLYNFMDGMDGLAGGMAVAGFGALALLGLRTNSVEYAMVAGTISVAALGFTVSNFPPARIFMGDSGSVPLGFLLGVMTLRGASRGIVPLWAGVLLFSPFFVDASVTLVRRILRGENPAKAHRQHYYQRLIMRGFSHTQVALLEYSLMLFCALSVWWGRAEPPRAQWVIITVWAVVYGILALMIDQWPKQD